MKSILIRLGLLALMISALASCGGNDGSTGSAGTPGAPGTPGTGGSVVQATNLTAAQWLALKPSIDPASVSVNMSSGKPVVKFTVTDGNGNALTGLGGQALSKPNALNGLPAVNYNFSFTLAKLIPAANGSPSKWVNYLVTKPVATTTPPVTGSFAADGLSWLGTYPTPETQGTMVDNGDGTYQYTFLRDITHAKAIVAGLTDSGANVKADLGDLTYDPTLSHRLGIFIAGSQPGTGVNTPDATAQTTPVPLIYTFNMGYDFRPDGGTITATRDIVAKGSCNTCHNNSNGRAIGHISTTGTSKLAVSYSSTGVATTVVMSNGIPPGEYVGRNDPRLCVTCHTDQTKYGFAVVAGDGTLAYGNSAYFRVATGVLSDNQAAFTYPRMIHQTHMGSQLVKTGYNLNGHDANCASNKLAGNAAQCFNLVGYPRDQRNCAACHDGSATKSDGSVNANQTKDGDNWKNVPSQLACGACHDGINFATGSGVRLADKYADIAAGNPVGTTQSHHGAGAPLPDNTLCVSCHSPAGIALVHATNFSTLNNPVATSGVDTVAYKIKSVTVNASGNPVVAFQVILNGSPVSSLAVAPTVVNGVTGAVAVNTYAPLIPSAPELLSGPSVYLAFAVPQDGINTPSDFNARFSVSLANLLIDTTKGVTPTSPAQGFLSNTVSAGAFLADANGYFTATLTGDTLGQPVGAGCAAPAAGVAATCVNTKVSQSWVVVPSAAAMVTGAVIGGFNQTNLTAYPYTAGDLTTNAATAAVGSGLHVTAVLQKMVASTCSQAGATSACTTARREIVSLANCNNCHEQLGTNQYVDNAPLATGMRLGFHNGDRNDPQACNICHNGNGVDKAGIPYDSATWYHGIHGASKRTVPFIGSGGLDYSPLLFPGALKNCSNCHLPNTANLGIAEATGQLANKLWTYAATGTITTPTTAMSQITGVVTTPYTFPAVPAGTLVAAPTAVYGSGFIWAIPASGVPAAGTYTPAATTTLVNTPIAAACSSCHDTPVAQSHIAANGGQMHAARGAGAALVNTEQCVVCHGQGRAMDAVVIHGER